MSGQKALTNIYNFAKRVGLIDKIPNVVQIEKSLDYFVGLQNAVYDILSQPSNITTKRQQLAQLGVFDRTQIQYILSNQSKIRQPFDRVVQNRQLTPYPNQKKLSIQVGSGILSIPKLNVNSYDELVSAIQNKMRSVQPPLSKNQIIEILKHFGISPEIVQLLTNTNPQELIEMAKELLNTAGFKMPDMAQIKLTDWVFFPLWSLENMPLVGPILGMPIDFMSIMVADLDIILGTFVDTLDNFREPAIQAASSAFAVATVGTGLVATPILVPLINRFFDLVIHIVGHFGTILNMFINISRKNFGLAYVLFCEIVPIFETIMNVIINYMVIFNRVLSRGGRFLDIYLVFLTNLERVLFYSNPANLTDITNTLVAKFNDKYNKMSGLAGK